jgi:hypothetical protein
MNIKELTTWDRLLALNLDAADTALPFSARLARDNDWTPDFAARAIDEYRKFCFLAVHAGHPVTPSDEVDQVWHLHLLYSRHYWDTLCRDTLGIALHHGPTEGGEAEDRKFHSWYEATLASYRRYFGEPSRDLWRSADERFHDEHDFIRVNRRDVVTLDRAVLRRGALAVLAGGGVLVVAHAFAQSGEASDGPAIAFGVLIAGVLPLALIVGAAIGTRRRRGHRPRQRSASDGAAVAGGAAGGGSSVKCADGNAGGDCAPAPDGGAGGGGAVSGCGGGSGGCGGGGGS